jgi:hypothetical protein
VIPWVSGLILKWFNKTTGVVEASVMTFVTWGLLMVLAVTVVRFERNIVAHVSVGRQPFSANRQLPRFQMAEALEAA